MERSHSQEAGEGLPLLDMQRAYLRGRNVKAFANEQATHAVIEYRCRECEAEELACALAALLGDHETFRMVVREEQGQASQRLEQTCEKPALRQIDGRFLSSGAAEQLLEEERCRLFNMSFDPFSLPRYAASIVLLADAETAVLLAVDGMLLDGHGISLLAKDLDARLRERHGCVDLRFSSYIEARTEFEQAYRESPEAEADRRFWTNLLRDHAEVPQFPPVNDAANTALAVNDECGTTTDSTLNAQNTESKRGTTADDAPNTQDTENIAANDKPDLATLADSPVARPATYQVTRTIPARVWESFSEAAYRHDTTPFVLAATLYGHAISRYTGAEQFAVNIPQRPICWAHLPEVLGMTSSFTLLPFADGPEPLMSKAAALTDTFFEMSDHSQLNGPTLLRALTQDQGRLFEAPITFTMIEEALPKDSRVTVECWQIHTSQTLLETALFQRANGDVEITIGARRQSIDHSMAEGIAHMLEGGIRGFAEGSLDETSTELPLSAEGQALASRINDASPISDEANTPGEGDVPTEANIRACIPGEAGAPTRTANRTDDPMHAPNRARDAELARGIAPLSFLIEQSLRSHGDSPAIVGEFGTVSYRELYFHCVALLEAVARTFPTLQRTTTAEEYDRTRILEEVAGHHETVGLLLPKGHKQIIASIACVLGSVSYMPIDPELPVNAVIGACENAGINKLIVANETLELADRASRMTLLNMDETAPVNTSANATGEYPELDDETRKHLNRHTPHLLCINTSGSTGIPKTISLNDWALTNCLLETRRIYDLDDKTRAIALTNIGHDMALFDTFAPLLYGGCVIALDEKSQREPRAWRNLIERFQVNTWSSVPAFMQMLLEMDNAELVCIAPALKTCIFGGDFLGVSLCRKIRRAFPAARIFNCGGPSETTLWNISHEVTERDLASAAIPYGKPFPGSSYYVLDEHKRPCPACVQGNMHVGGLTLSNGYLRENRLVHDGFCQYGEESVYTTGDRGSYDPLIGELLIHGRCDKQVKINGKRIELGGIETVLSQAPEVGQAVVVLHETGKLAAFVTANDPAGAGGNSTGNFANTSDSASTSGFASNLANASASNLASGPASALANSIDEASLRAYAAETLPQYMVPATIVQLEAIPLTRNTKVDRNALATYDLGKAPRTPRAVSDDFPESHTGGTAGNPTSNSLGNPASCPQGNGPADSSTSNPTGDFTGGPANSPAHTPASNLSENSAYAQAARFVEEVLETVFDAPVTLEDNFYFMGGDSIIAMRASAMLERTAGISVAVYDLLGRPQLADWVDLAATLLAEKQQPATANVAVVEQRIAQLVQQLLPLSAFDPNDDFLAIGGDADLAAAIAATLSREFDATVSRYDLVFSSRIRDWPEIVAASMSTETPCTTT